MPQAMHQNRIEPKTQTTVLRVQTANSTEKPKKIEKCNSNSGMHRDRSESQMPVRRPIASQVPPTNRRRVEQHERQHADVFAGQQHPPRRRLGQQHAHAPAVEKAGQESGRPDQRQQQAERVGHAAGQDQLQEMDRVASRRGASGTRIAPKASVRSPLATTTPDCFSFADPGRRDRRRGRKSGFSPGAASVARPSIANAQANADRNQLTASSIQKMPVGQRLAERVADQPADGGHGEGCEAEVHRRSEASRFAAVARDAL